MNPESAVSQSVCAGGLLPPLLDAAPEVLLFLDREGKVLLVSQAVKAFFGLAPEDMIGRSINDFAEPFSRCFTEFMTYHEVVALPLQDCEQDFLRDVEITSPQHRFMQISSAPVKKGDVCLGRFWIMRDVTHEREITELKIQYGGIRSADEIKSKFLTVASHQLRTPMNSIRWNLELLLSGDGGVQPPETIETLREVYKSVVNSISIIDDMLLAVDIEQRTLRLEKAAADIGEVVSKAVREASRSAALKSIVLTLHDLPKNLPPLFLDHDKIGTALNRILDNAIKYTPENGRIDVEVKVGKTGVSVSIKDSGIGIPEKDRSRLFERFYRSKKAIEINPNASGLGLYISKFIVDAHDGSVEVASEEGKGATFTLTLPRRAAT